MKILTKRMLAYKNFQRFSYPNDMDEEMIDLMDVLSNIPGCRTMYCCQGHGTGSWYFVVNCCNTTSLRVIREYFWNKQKINPLIEILEGSAYTLEDQVPERQISIYDKTFDKMTLKKKKIAYKDMCEHFLKFVPSKHWSGK